MQEDRRRDYRYTANARYIFRWQDQSGQKRSAQVQGVDVSKSGMRVSHDLELPPGSIVFIEGDGHGPTGDGIVRHCARFGAGYSIGLEFSEETKKTLTAPTADAIDCYEFLQISRNAECGTIERIHRFLAARFHPDNPDTGDLEKFLLLQHAYEVLSDPERRAAYDAARDARECGPLPIFKMAEFVNGVEGELNRRLGIMSLLYNQRRTNPRNPAVPLVDLEKRMGWPREYLDFSTWYLCSKQYITKEDNSDFALTALGADFVEGNAAAIPVLDKLLNIGTPTATSSRRTEPAPATSSAGIFRLGPGQPVAREPWAGKEDALNVHENRAAVPEKSSL